MMDNFVDRRKYNILRSRFDKLKYTNSKNVKIIEQFNKERTSITNMHGENLTLRKKGNIIYLDTFGVPKTNCSICKEIKKTTSHHIIPKRLGAKNILLSKVRIRVCEECESDIHPENAVITEQEIIDKLKRRIDDYKNKNNLDFNKDKKEFTEKIDLKIKRLEANVKTVPSRTIDKKRILPKQKIYEGRIKELKFIKKVYINYLCKIHGMPTRYKRI